MGIPSHHHGCQYYFMVINGLDDLGYPYDLGNLPIASYSDPPMIAGEDAPEHEPEDGWGVVISSPWPL